ncbi:kynureninase, partial [Microscilla marina ATCC 23134]
TRYKIVMEAGAFPSDHTLWNRRRKYTVLPMKMQW